MPRFFFRRWPALWPGSYSSWKSRGWLKLFWATHCFTFWETWKVIPTKKTIGYVYAAAGDDDGVMVVAAAVASWALYHPNLPKIIPWWQDAYWRQDSLWLLYWSNSDSFVWGPRATVAEAPFLCRIWWRRVMPRGTLGCFRWCQTSTIREASNQTKGPKDSWRVEKRFGMSLNSG